MGLLDGKSAIITGSSRGIGRAIAKAFADNGAGLVIHGTNESQLAPLAEELGCEFVAGDIGELSTSEKLADKCMKRCKEKSRLSASLSTTQESTPAQNFLTSLPKNGTRFYA